MLRLFSAPPVLRRIACGIWRESVAAAPDIFINSASRPPIYAWSPVLPSNNIFVRSGVCCK